MVDANHAYSRREALSLARAIEEHDIGWFEEPLSGGITETKKILDMAQAFGVEYAPHCWGSAVGLAAAVHLLANWDTVPGRMREPEPLLELDRTRNVFREELAHPRLADQGGRVRVPDGPGLGIDVDEDLVQRYSVKS